MFRVNTKTTPKVEYAYSEMDSGANHSRLTSMTCPDGRVLNYNYGTGLNDDISRLVSIFDNSATLEEYDYLGLATVVRRGHPEPGVDQTFIKQSGESNGDAGDQYIGLDRFGRIVDQRWIETTTPDDIDRFQYGYDRNSNRTYRENMLDAVFSELYAYDSLNQLTSFDRGELNGTKDGIVGTPSRSQDWDLDAIGNWDSLTNDGGTPESRTHNSQNQVTAVGGATLTFDFNGNMTKDEAGRELAYDAWNRLVDVLDDQQQLIVSHDHDALGRRIAETRGTETRDLYYSASWQVLEEQVSGETEIQYVWSPVYVDAMILRDRDTDANGTLDERLYVAHDANWNVTALIDTSGAIVERYVYDPYGSPTIYNADWSQTRSSSDYDWQYRHQGGRYSFDIGLYHFRNRDLSPTLGRWNGSDPIGFEGGDFNLYRYLNNLPTIMSDPSGLAGQDLPQNQWPRWVRRLIGRPDPYNPNGPREVDGIRGVHYDRNHAGGAHYDVEYELDDGSTKRRRFWRDGRPLTRSENRALDRGLRPRRGTFRVSAAASMGLTAITVGGVAVVYDHYVATGAQAALDVGVAAFTCRYIRALLHSAELPEVYDRFGVIRERYFTIELRGQLIRVFIERRPGGGNSIHATSNGEIIIQGCNCPLSGG